jgi:hypothetical protein
MRYDYKCGIKYPSQMIAYTASCKNQLNSNIAHVDEER